MKPIIVINLKTYKSGKNVDFLVNEIQKVDSRIIIGVSSLDLGFLQKIKNPLYLQHVDSIDPGRNTGFVVPENAKKRGAKGVFLNHSEHRIDFKELKKSLGLCKKLKLKVLVFVNDSNMAKKVDKLEPDYLVYEPPELVAGNKSVTNAKPEVIKKITHAVKSKVLVGAGIKTKQDIDLALKYGAKGVAFASVITSAKNPRKVLKDLGC